MAETFSALVGTHIGVAVRPARGPLGISPNMCERHKQRHGAEMACSTGDEFQSWEVPLHKMTKGSCRQTPICSMYCGLRSYSVLCILFPPPFPGKQGSATTSNPPWMRQY